MSFFHIRNRPEDINAIAINFTKDPTAKRPTNSLVPLPGGVIQSAVLATATRVKVKTPSATKAQDNAAAR